MTLDAALERMMGSNVNLEYLRRNLLVCKAVGAHAGASKSLERLRRMKRPPKWLVKSLEGVVERAEPLVSALACYRAVVPSHLTDNPRVEPK